MVFILTIFLVNQKYVDLELSISRFTCSIHLLMCDYYHHFQVFSEL